MAEATGATRVCVALPVYEEAGALDGLMERWRATLEELGRPFRLVVADDGSRDDCPRILRCWAERVPMRVLTHPVNMGLGATLRDALTEAARTSEPSDVIVTMDGDGTHPPELFPQMLRLIESDRADVVIASRFRTGSRVVGVGPVRELASLGARLLYSAVFPIRGVRDYTCGYRALRASCLQRALRAFGGRFFEEAGFESTADVLLKLSTLGCRFAEVPLVLRYDLKRGRSKMRVLRTTAGSLRLLLRRRLGLRRIGGRRGSA